MGKEQILNRIEHKLLSMQTNDIEPLFILYADTKRDVEAITLDLVLKALLKLVDMGFSECIIHNGEKWQPCKHLTLTKLKKRFQGQTEEEQVEYPMHVNEYYFKITEKGREEEAKEVYDSYYSQK